MNVDLTNASHITVGGETNPDNLFVAGTQGEIGPGEVTCQTLGSGFASYSTATGPDASANPPFCGLDTLNQDGSLTNIPQVEFTTGSANDLLPRWTVAAN